MKKTLSIIGGVMVFTCILFFIVMINITPSINEGPASQISFTENLNSYRSKIEEVNNGENQIQISKVEKEITAFLDLDRTVDFWRVEVDSIYQSENHIQIRSTYNSNQYGFGYGQIYNLSIESAAAQELVSNLKKGDHIFFSGLIGKEMSITFSGKIEQPEYYLSPTEIKIAENDIPIKSSN